MRITAGKATDNGLGVHPAEPFPFPAADEKLVCTPPQEWEKNEKDMVSQQQGLALIYRLDRFQTIRMQFRGFKQVPFALQW